MYLERLEKMMSKVGAWEIIDEDTLTYRMDIDGGWLYAVGDAIAFVPDRAIESAVKALEGDGVKQLLEAVLNNKAIFKLLQDKAQEAIEEAFRIVAEEQDDSLDEM